MTTEELLEAIKPLEEKMFAWDCSISSADDLAESFSDYEIDLLIDALSGMEYSIDPDYYPEVCDIESKGVVVKDYICRTLCEMMVSGCHSISDIEKWFDLYRTYYRSRYGSYA